MNRDSNILIYHISDKKTTIINVYINYFFIASTTLNIIDIVKEILSQKFSIKNLKEV